jgi:hypothetical protein
MGGGGAGVRFNAEKKKVGMYYTTPILSFRMKCHLCDNWFVIQTDPKVRTRSAHAPPAHHRPRLLRSGTGRRVGVG